MNGAQKCMMIVYCVLAVCLTILYSFLFLALWPYRSYVGITLLVVIVFVIVVPVSVHARGKLNEQALRHQRYRYKEEIPFDAMGGTCLLASRCPGQHPPLLSTFQHVSAIHEPV